MYNILNKLKTYIRRDDLIYLIMFSASSVVGYSYASLAIRAINPFLSQLHSYRVIATRITYIGVAITGTLNTLLYWDIGTLKKLINKKSKFSLSSLLISLFSGAFEAFTMLMSYPSSLGGYTYLFASLYFVTASILYLPDSNNKQTGLEKTFNEFIMLFNGFSIVKFNDWHEKTINKLTAWVVKTPKLSLAMITINFYGTYLMCTALSSDLILASQKLGKIISARFIPIIIIFLQLLRGLYTYANVNFYYERAKFVTQKFQSNIKPNLTTLYGIMIVSLTLINALVNGFINTLNTAISLKTLFNIIVSGMMSCTAMLKNFFDNQPDEIKECEQDKLINTINSVNNSTKVKISCGKVDLFNYNYSQTSFRELVPDSNAKLIGLTMVSMLWTRVLQFTLPMTALIGSISFASSYLLKNNPPSTRSSKFKAPLNNHEKTPENKREIDQVNSIIKVHYAQ